MLPQLLLLPTRLEVFARVASPAKIEEAAPAQPATTL